ncbi:VWA domain-containing protein [Thiothrix subterranea]|uniref:VWA domain-containing protein n=1 Tax=Thiothrix subterranea TaxID=2735563 RepID=UPI001D18B509|nr:VWA domain-containing protein [Thiothrix subterranea]
MLNNLHFLHPEWLWLLLVLPLVLGIKWFQARQQGGWERIVDKQLMPFVLSGTAGNWGWLPLAWLSLALLVAIVAMAGPAWEKREVPVFRDQQALVVAMDFSVSMYADDEKPNRITLARFKLLDILNARQDAQNGLVVFAGDAFVVTPLTDDVATIQEQVKNLAPDIMPAPGSLLTPAIERSIELLQQAGMKTGSILLMTDGVADTESAVAAADKAWGMGYNVSVLSLGSADGAAIPRPRGGFLLDSAGKTVIATVNLDDLARIAKAGGGIFMQAALGDADVNALSQQWQSLSQQQLSKSQGRQTDAWVNEGYWLVLLLLPLAALTFRRGWLGAVLVCILLPQPQTATAFSWDDLWLTPDQQAQEALDSGQPARASELFHNPEWKGASAYKNKDYQTAAQQYAAQQSITGQYNYGNAQAKAGKFKEAIIAYKRVLEADPNHEDARHNLKIVEEALQQQQQQEEQNQKNSQKNQPQQQPQDQQGADQQQAQGAQGQDSQTPQPNNSPDQQQQAQEENAAEHAEQEAEQAKQGEQETEANDPQQREQEQATEQWLRRIPDDPSGLWRRKFQYQYQQRGAQARGDEW